MRKLAEECNDDHRRENKLAVQELEECKEELEEECEKVLIMEENHWRLVKELARCEKECEEERRARKLTKECNEDLRREKKLAVQRLEECKEELEKEREKALILEENHWRLLEELAKCEKERRVAPSERAGRIQQGLLRKRTRRESVNSFVSDKGIGMVSARSNKREMNGNGKRGKRLSLLVMIYHRATAKARSLATCKRTDH